MMAKYIYKLLEKINYQIMVTFYICIFVIFFVYPQQQNSIIIIIIDNYIK